MLLLLHRLYATSPPTELPTYCNIGPPPAVYFCIICELGYIRQFLGRALCLGHWSLLTGALVVGSYIMGQLQCQIAPMSILTSEM